LVADNITHKLVVIAAIDVLQRGVGQWVPVRGCRDSAGDDLVNGRHVRGETDRESLGRADCLQLLQREAGADDDGAVWNRGRWRE
jgi:hypothetical protein